MTKEETEKRSEEVQDIVERMPTRWAAWTALVVAILMTVVTVLAFIIEYPDTVAGQISLTADKAPVRLVAGSTGRLHLLVQNRQLVSVGQTIAYIENGASMDDVALLEEVTDEVGNGLAAEDLPRGLMLGDLSASYNSYLLAREQFEIIKSSKAYDNMRRSLTRQIDTDTKVAQNMDEEIRLKKATLAIVAERTRKDSILHSKGAMSQEEYENRRKTLIAQTEANTSLHSSRLAKMSDVGRNKIELAKIDVDEEESMRKLHADMTGKLNKLRSDIRQWKEKYLLVSPIGGRLEYLSFWRENSFVQAGRETFSVLPDKNRIVGEAHIPAGGAGKVKIGQEANIKLDDYPYNEYGLIKGRVEAMSAITNNVAARDGTVETYLVTIQLPQGTTTNYGKRLKLNFEAKGRVDIITRQKKLVERLFDNLKSKQVK